MTDMRPPNKTTLLKVVILGDGGIGKSCLMNRFVSNRYDENNFHTIGIEFMNKDIEVDGEKYTLQIWDTAGQERFRALRTPFYRGSDVCMLCYAVNDLGSFRGLKQWRHEFVTYADVKLEKFPFIVVGNKNDLPANHRSVSFDEVDEWCQNNSIVSHIETSSKTATNVTDAFVLAVRQWKIMEQQTQAEIRSSDAINLSRPIRLVQNRLCCNGAPYSNVNNNIDDEDYMNSNQQNNGSPKNRFGFRKNKKVQHTNFQL